MHLSYYSSLSLPSGAEYTPSCVLQATSSSSAPSSGIYLHPTSALPLPPKQAWPWIKLQHHTSHFVHCQGLLRVNYIGTLPPPSRWRNYTIKPTSQPRSKQPSVLKPIPKPKLTTNTPLDVVSTSLALKCAYLGMYVARIRFFLSATLYSTRSYTLLFARCPYSSGWRTTTQPTSSNLLSRLLDTHRPTMHHMNPKDKKK